jgi:hypothetical protein
MFQLTTKRKKTLPSLFVFLILTGVMLMTENWLVDSSWYSTRSNHLDFKETNHVVLLSTEVEYNCFKELSKEIYH